MSRSLIEVEVEECIKRTFHRDYPHVKISWIDEIAKWGAKAAGAQANKIFRRDAPVGRRVDFQDLPREVRERIYEFAVRAG